MLFITSKALHFTPESAKQNGISVAAAAQIGFGVDKLLKVGGSIEGRDATTLSKALQTGAGKNLSEAVAKMESFARQDAANASDSATQDKATSYLTQQQQTQNWAKIDSFVKENRVALNTNATDDVIDQVANHMFGGDRTAAIKWSHDHPRQFATVAAGSIAQQVETLKEKVSSVDHVLSNSELMNININEKARDLTPHSSIQNHTSRLRDEGEKTIHNAQQQLQFIEGNVNNQDQKTKGEYNDVDFKPYIKSKTDSWVKADFKSHVKSKIDSWTEEK